MVCNVGYGSDDRPEHTRLWLSWCCIDCRGDSSDSNLVLKAQYLRVKQQRRIKYGGDVELGTVVGDGRGAVAMLPTGVGD